MGLPARRLLAGHLLGVHLLAVVLVAAAGWLGWWQVEAWQDRREAEASDLTRMAPAPLTDVMGPDDPFPGDQVGRPVTGTGEWLRAGTFFVAGREHAGREGYWVVTPLDLGEAAVLVVRGWSQDPSAPVPRGPVDLVGWLQPTEGATGLVDEDPSDDVLPQLRVADAVQRVDTDLFGAYVVLDAARTPLEPGLEPADLAALPEVGRFTAVHNLLYGVEWWFFGAFAAFIWWRHVRDVLAEQDPAGEHDDPSPGDAG